MRKLRMLLCAALSVLLLVLFPAAAFASSPTDEILLYEITADVNGDGTVNLDYHIQWKVLESDGIGPMSWISVGIPNSHVIDAYGTSGIVDSVEISGSNASVYLDRDYYEGEVADIGFTLTQDYMYAMNQLEAGYTNYYFTPGWFDEITVDEYIFRWNADQASSWSPSCQQNGGYLTWTGSLGPGETMSISVDYPNEAFAFNESKSYSNLYDEYDNWDDWDDDYYGYNSYDPVGPSFGAVFFIIMISVFAIALKAKKEYDSTATFGSGETKKKITRTKVEYYPVCQGCGAPREEGQETCTHCGRSYIKSEETVTEEEVKAEDKDALKHNTNGVYHFGASPNTYMRVNVINVPVHTSRSTGSRPGGSRPSGRSGGGCAHSSCACACASCACACACACAGGGRAGCTYKDFYKTDLKLKQLKMKSAKRK